MAHSSKVPITVSTIGKTEFGKWSVIVVSIVRSFISLLIMAVIDILMLIKLRNQIRQTQAMRRISVY